MTNQDVERLLDTCSPIVKGLDVALAHSNDPVKFAKALADVRKTIAQSKHKMKIFLVLFVFALGVYPARAQGRDSLLNGVVIGAAVGAGAGVAFTHAVRDSDLTFGQYARGAVIFGAIGAGIGLGVDALLDRAPRPGVKPPRVLIVPTVWRDIAGIGVKWRW